MPTRDADVTRDSTTVALPAELTDEAVDELGPSLRQLVSGDGCAEVRLDGRAVHRLTARGLDLLVALARIGAENEVQVRISHASAQLMAALALGRLLDRLDIDYEPRGGQQSTTDVT